MSYPRSRRTSSAGFTLIELLVVMAIIAVVSVVVILTLNPTQLLAQARDSDRLSDASVLTNAFGVFAVDQPSAALGTAFTSYVSLADASSTCFHLGLQTAPSSWTYQCSSAANLEKVNGTGWIPVNFASITSGAPIAQLPIDPVNASSSNSFFGYAASGTQYEVSSVLESQKYVSQAASDGGYDPSLFETGNNVTLMPFIDGLIAYWNFDAGNNTSVPDLSGYGDTLTWNGTSTSHYTTGKFGANAAFFGGNSDYLSPSFTGGLAGGKFPGDFTVAFWAKGDGDTAPYPNYVGTHMCGCSDPSWSVGTAVGAGNDADWRIQDVGEGHTATTPAGSIVDSNWHFIVAERSGVNMYAYMDGVLVGSAVDGSSPWNLSGGSGINVGTASSAGPYLKNDGIDSLRIYDRALTQAQITALYNANN